MKKTSMSKNDFRPFGAKKNIKKLDMENDPRWPPPPKYQCVAGSRDFSSSVFGIGFPFVSVHNLIMNKYE